MPKNAAFAGVSARANANECAAGWGGRSFITSAFEPARTDTRPARFCEKKSHDLELSTDKKQSWGGYTILDPGVNPQCSASGKPENKTTTCRARELTWGWTSRPLPLASRTGAAAAWSITGEPHTPDSTPSPRTPLLSHCVTTHTHTHTQPSPRMGYGESCFCMLFIMLSHFPLLQRQRCRGTLLMLPNAACVRSISSSCAFTLFVPRLSIHITGSS